jgi:hypothetical protein
MLDEKLLVFVLGAPGYVLQTYWCSAGAVAVAVTRLDCVPQSRQRHTVRPDCQGVWMDSHLSWGSITG